MQDESTIDASTIENALFRVGEIVQYLEAGHSLREELATTLQAHIVQQQGAQAVAGDRAHAFTSLGKLCVDDVSLARKCITIFLRELKESPAASVRNNVLVVMCDLCRKHTAIVDRHVDAMAIQMGDPNPTVRRQAVALLSHLVHLDFLKL